VALRPPDPSETLVVLARALGEQGEFDRSREVIDDAVERARRGGDRRLELHARIEQALLASLLDTEGSMAELDRVVDEALPVFEELGDDAGLASTYGARSWFYSVAHRFEQRQAAAYRAIEHARRAGDQGLEVQLELELTGTYVYGPLPVQEGILRCEKALARPALNTRVRTSYLSALGLLTVMGGRLEEGFELLADAQRTADERGWLMALVASGELAAIAQQLAGRNKEAEATIRPGYELLENRGEKGLLSTHAARVAELVYRQGRHDEALHYAKVSKELGSSEDVITQVLWRQVRAKVLASRGESKEAERLAREAVTLGEPTDALMMRADALADLGEVLRLAGKSGEAREAYEQALALYEQKGIVPAAERARESLTLLPIE
jgi:tetratricopeptide (TPR) repeat protein